MKKQIIRVNVQDETKKLGFIKDELPKICDSMMNGISRIKKLTQKLKTFSRSSNAEMTYVNMNECASNALIFAKESISKKFGKKQFRKSDFNEKFGFLVRVLCFGKELVRDLNNDFDMGFLVRNCLNINRRVAPTFFLLIFVEILCKDYSDIFGKDFW